MMRGLCLLGVMLLLIPAVCQAGIGSELNGLASFGASGGFMRWFADSDARSYNGHAAQVRLMGKAVFRYRFSTDWLGAIEAGYGWNGYQDSGDMTLVVIPLTAGVERRVGEVWHLTASAAAGGGIYIWGLRRDGQFLRDPETSERLQATSPGVYLGGTGEFHVSTHVTSTVQVVAHYMLATGGQKDDFPTALGGDDVFTEVRIGLNYYFSPYEGLIWGTDED